MKQWYGLSFLNTLETVAPLKSKYDVKHAVTIDRTRVVVARTDELSLMRAGMTVGTLARHSLAGFVNAIIADDAPHIQAIRGNG